MNNDSQRNKRVKEAAQRALQEAQIRKAQEQEVVLPREINGTKGKEPTRYKDWERKGIAYDF